MKPDRVRAALPAACGVLLVAAVVAVAARLADSAPQPVLAASALADDSFAVCTAVLDEGIEGFFMLDFQTGDLTGAVLNRATGKFGVGYRHNVLKDLNFKATKVKNAKFLLAPGVLTGGAQQAASVLYVTDAATGMTVVYGIPWGQGAVGPQTPLVPLDRLNPRGGGEKVP